MIQLIMKNVILEQYEEEKFNITAPFKLHITDFPANLSTGYTDVTEQLINDRTLVIHM